MSGLFGRWMREAGREGFFLQVCDVLVEVFEVFVPGEGDGKDAVHQNQGI